jgi:hypothetical protein
MCADHVICRQGVGFEAGADDIKAVEPRFLGDAGLVAANREAVFGNGNVEVTGSIPIVSTNKIKGLTGALANPLFLPEAPRKPAIEFRPVSRPPPCSRAHARVKCCVPGLHNRSSELSVPVARSIDWPKRQGVKPGKNPAETRWRARGPQIGGWEPGAGGSFSPAGMVAAKCAAGDPTRTGRCLPSVGPIRMARGWQKIQKSGGELGREQ